MDYTFRAVQDGPIWDPATWALDQMPRVDEHVTLDARGRRINLRPVEHTKATLANSGRQGGFVVPPGGHLTVGPVSWWYRLRAWWSGR